jgi:hypothetical protein
MKKSPVSSSTPDLGQVFSGLTIHEALVVPDNPEVEADAEVRAYQMFLEVARLYCTRQGQTWPSSPKAYFSSEEKWGPYYISLLPYDKNSPGYETDSEEGERAFDPDIYDGLRELAGDFSLVARLGCEAIEREGAHVLSFNSIEALLQHTYDMLLNEDCPGGFFERTRLRNGIEKIVRATAIEKAQDGLPLPGFHWNCD